MYISTLFSHVLLYGTYYRFIYCPSSYISTFLLTDTEVSYYMVSFSRLFISLIPANSSITVDLSRKINTQHHSHLVKSDQQYCVDHESYFLTFLINALLTSPPYSAARINVTTSRNVSSTNKKGFRV